MNILMAFLFLVLPLKTMMSFEDKDYIFVFERNKEEDGKPFTEYRMIQIKKGFCRK